MARHAPAVAEGLRISFERCLAAYETCRQARLHHRASRGEEASAELLDALDACAEQCRVCFDLLFGASRRHAAACPVCLEIGRCCAESCASAAALCRSLSGHDQVMRVCAEVCESCARSCRRLS